MQVESRLRITSGGGLWLCDVPLESTLSLEDEESVVARVLPLHAAIACGAHKELCASASGLAPSAFVAAQVAPPNLIHLVETSYHSLHAAAASLSPGLKLRITITTMLTFMPKASAHSHDHLDHMPRF